MVATEVLVVRTGAFVRGRLLFRPKTKGENMGSKEMENEEKAGRLAHQFGKFGEGLVLWWLGHFYNYNVALVDHEGADIVAHKGDEHLAISVKSIHAASIYYDTHNQKQLKIFAEKFGNLKPAVAFVFAWGDREKDKEDTMIDVFLFKLEEIKKYIDNNEKGFGIKNGDYYINNGANFNILKSVAEKYNAKHLRLHQIHEDFDLSENNKK